MCRPDIVLLYGLILMILQFFSDRLDRRWKRVALVIWIPFFLFSFLYLILGLISIYYVHFAFDHNILSCHRTIAQNEQAAIGRILGHSNPHATWETSFLASKRFNARSNLFSDAGAEARLTEKEPAFIRCMLQTPNGAWWAEYPFTLYRILGFVFCVSIFALIVLPKFWRKLGSWILMKPNV